MRAVHGRYARGAWLVVGISLCYLVEYLRTYVTGYLTAILVILDFGKSGEIPWDAIP